MSEKMNHVDYQNYARGIAEEAWDESEKDEERARELIEQTIDGCYHVIYYSRAWDLVNVFRELSPYNRDYYDQAHVSLMDTEGDKIGKDETIDNVMVRLAYWILEAIAMERLEELVKNNENS